MAGCVFVQMMILMPVIVDFANGDASMTASNSRPLRCRKPRKTRLIAQLNNATLSFQGHNVRDPERPWHRPCVDNRTRHRYAANIRPDWTDGRSRPLKDRSLCPWIVAPVRQNDRFPKTIAEARCLCGRCRLEGSTHRCLPINHPMIVLRRTASCDDRRFAVYHPVTHLVVVGCTCVDVSTTH